MTCIAGPRQARLSVSTCWYLRRTGRVMSRGSRSDGSASRMSEPSTGVPYGSPACQGRWSTRRRRHRTTSSAEPFSSTRFIDEWSGWTTSATRSTCGDRTGGRASVGLGRGGGRGVVATRSRVDPARRDVTRASAAVAQPGALGPRGKRLTTSDMWFDNVGMAVMVHSRQSHAGVLQWDATVDAAADLSANRVVVIGVTPTALARDPPAVLRRVETAYLTARRTGARASDRTNARRSHSRGVRG